MKENQKAQSMLELTDLLPSFCRRLGVSLEGRADVNKGLILCLKDEELRTKTIWSILVGIMREFRISFTDKNIEGFLIEKGAKESMGVLRVRFSKNPVPWAGLPDPARP